MALRLSDSVKIDSTDGKNIRYTTDLSSGTRTYEYECTNTSFYYRIVETVKAHNSDLFDNVGLTDSATLFTQPAHAVLVAVKMRLDEQFVAAGMTSLKVVVGDAGWNSGILNPTIINFISDGVGTEYAERGGYWAFPNPAGYCDPAAHPWIGYATAVGANLSTTTAGQVTFYFYYLEI